jgi:hypothetical protein
MKFRIEFSDNFFRLVVLESNGEEDYLEAVLYCSVSSVVAADGKVYGAYLTGSEAELDTLSNHPTDSTMIAKQIKVYEIGAWPTLKAVDAMVTLEETDFDDVDEEDDEEETPDNLEVI